MGEKKLEGLRSCVARGMALGGIFSERQSFHLADFVHPTATGGVAVCAAGANLRLLGGGHRNLFQ